MSLADRRSFPIQLRRFLELEDPLDLSCFRILSGIAFTAILACNAPAIRAQAADGILKLNQIQVIGTHNSYHAGIAPNESKIWQAKYADAYKGLDYQHQ